MEDTIFTVKTSDGESVEVSRRILLGSVVFSDMLNNATSEMRGRVVNLDETASQLNLLFGVMDAEKEPENITMEDVKILVQLGKKYDIPLIRFAVWEQARRLAPLWSRDVLVLAVETRNLDLARFAIIQFGRSYRLSNYDAHYTAFTRLNMDVDKFAESLDMRVRERLLRILVQMLTREGTWTWEDVASVFKLPE